MTTNTRYVLVTAQNVDRLFALAEGPDADQIVLAVSIENIEAGFNLGRLMAIPLHRSYMQANVGMALTGKDLKSGQEIHITMNQCNGRVMWKLTDGDPNPIHGWTSLTQGVDEFSFFIPEPAHVAVSEH